LFTLYLYYSGLYIFNKLRKLLVGKGTSINTSTSVNSMKLVDCYRVCNSSSALMSPKAGLGSLSKNLS
jgi:hypothetical protein